jgi:hypothetical protein
VCNVEVTAEYYRFGLVKFLEVGSEINIPFFSSIIQSWQTSARIRNICMQQTYINCHLDRIKRIISLEQINGKCTEKFFSLLSLKRDSFRQADALSMTGQLSNGDMTLHCPADTPDRRFVISNRIWLCYSIVPLFANHESQKHVVHFTHASKN